MTRKSLSATVWSLANLSASLTGLAAALMSLTATPAAAQVAAAAEAPAYTAGDLYLPTCRVHALVGKTGLGHEHGVSGSVESGRLVLGATQDAGELVFDMASFVAETDAARKFVGLEGSTSESTRSQVNANMLGKDVLNVAVFPKARYVIASAVEEPPIEESQPGPHGAKRYRLSGDFTLQKTTRPLTLLVDVDVKNGWNRVRGSFKLKQTDFGIKPYTKAFGAVGVADEMTVWGELWVAPSMGVANE